MSDNIRIRTTPNGVDKYINMKLEQDFDFIEILSLTISQDKVYETFCADYGVIAGRVSINNGFGIPNARVSVFIPISDEDKNNPNILGLYPFETVNDVDSNGIRYNLLPKESDNQDDCYTTVGTFSSKREFLDNDEMLEIYDKYYKLTAITNYAGDFMIFGVPLGSHTVHIDADISNIGIASQKPYDLIDQGVPVKMFASPSKFKGGKNLNSLVQIKTVNAGVNVKPFWGDIDNCVIGINRLDIDLNYTAKPTAIFMGSIFGDSRKSSINKRCRPRKSMGDMCGQIPREGTIEMLRKTLEGEIEQFDVDGGRLIDNNGTWAYQVPMNLDYVITDENGDLIPSDDPEKGIATRARVRFRIGMDEGGGSGRLRTRGKYLIPNNPNNLSEIDFSFDKATSDNNHTFRDFYWNKIYTVKNFISRIEKNARTSYKNKTYTGIKNVDGCGGDKLPMPYNRAYVNSSVLFTFLCFIISLLANIVAVINNIICFLAKIITKKLKKFLIKLKCPNDEETVFTVGCTDKVSDYLNCVKAVLADELDSYQMDFYNDWINGALYFYPLKYKKTRKGREKFCETYCDDYGGTGNNSCKDSQLTDTTFKKRNDTATQSFKNGLLVKYEDNLYYPPILINGMNAKMFATDTVNLGAVNDCDWQGLPKIIDYITDTTYKIPPLVSEVENDQVVAGMFDYKSDSDGLFFNISCTSGVNYTGLKARNIRRQCELNVDNVEYSTIARDYIGIDEVYDTSDPIDSLTSINRYVRDSFYLLNVNGSGISSVPVITNNLLMPNEGTSFGVATAYNNGLSYDSFRGWATPLNGTDMSFQTKNSFYMYFGVMPGKTAIDKLKSKFFTPCVKMVSDDFIIDTTPTNQSNINTADGTISFEFIGGSYPFTYTWSGVDVSYSSGPITTLTTPPNGIITGLVAGTYQITATDILGTIVVKEVTVGSPLNLDCEYTISVYPSTETSTDGIIKLNYITNGTLPYTLEIYDINNSLATTPYVFQTAPVNVDILGLISGEYTFIATDSSGQSCTKQLSLTAPQGLQIMNTQKNNACDNCFGVLSFDILGGTPPYTVTLTTTATVAEPMTKVSDTSYANLCVADYIITVVDSGDPTYQTIQQPVSITNGFVITQTNIILIDLTNYVIDYSVTGGNPNYTVTANGNATVENNSIIDTNNTEKSIYYYRYTGELPLTINVIDDGGCEKTKVL
jgi:hypothetical protein